jgi:hypothetical protein
MSKPLKISQKKLVLRRRKRRLFASLWLLLYIGVIFGGLSFLSQADFLAIKDVRVEGNSRLDADVLSGIARAELAGNYMYFFSRANKFLYPHDAIEERIVASPIVEGVGVSREAGGVLVISVKERMEEAQWCGQKCFSINEEGFIFAEAAGGATSSTTASTTNIIYRGGLTAEPIGAHLLPVQDFKNSEFFIRQIASLGLEPVEVLLGVAGYMEVKLAKGGKLIINGTDDLSAVLSRLGAFVSDIKTVPNLAAFLAKLDYIRLDSGNKIFYKLK